MPDADNRENCIHVGIEWVYGNSFILLGSKITYMITAAMTLKDNFLLERKAMTNLNSILKSRGIILLTKVYIMKAMVFPVVMCRCEIWNIKKASEVKVTQSYLTLCDPMDYTVYGILQARVLEWVAFPFSMGSLQQGLNPGLLHCRQILYPVGHFIN